MTTVVGLDLSLTNAGIAVVADSRRAGVAWPFLLRTCGRDGHKGEDYRRRSRRVRKQVRDITDILAACGRPDLVVIEGPIYGGTFLPSYFDRAILFGGVYAYFDARDIPIAVVPPATGHMFTTGKGSMPKNPEALKPAIVAAVSAMVPGVAVADHDIADALGYAFMGAMALGVALPFRARRWQHEAVRNVVWPSTAAAVAAGG